MNMFKKSAVRTIDDYLSSLPMERRKELELLDELIKDTVPGLRPYFANNMLGYGSFRYRNYKNESIDWPIVAVASQKNYISVYVCSLEDGEYIVEKHKKLLGKVSVGKSCVRFKQLKKLDLEGFKFILKLAERKPGL